MKKIHIKQQEVISKQHIRAIYKWQGNSKTENHAELTGMNKNRIWISGEEDTALGLMRAGLGKFR